MSDHAITDWEASYGKLRITVVSRPFHMTKRFVWMEYTNNHYGQGSKRCWWYQCADETYSEVFDEDGQNLLTEMVLAHTPLRYLAHHYHIPENDTVVYMGSVEGFSNG